MTDLTAIVKEAVVNSVCLQYSDPNTMAFLKSLLLPDANELINELAEKENWVVFEGTIRFLTEMNDVVASGKLSFKPKPKLVARWAAAPSLVMLAGIVLHLETSDQHHKVMLKQLVDSTAVMRMLAAERDYVLLSRLLSIWLRTVSKNKDADKPARLSSMEVFQRSVVHDGLDFFEIGKSDLYAATLQFYPISVWQAFQQRVSASVVPPMQHEQFVLNDLADGDHNFFAAEDCPMESVAITTPEGNRAHGSAPADVGGGNVDASGLDYMYARAFNHGSCEGEEEGSGLDTAALNMEFISAGMGMGMGMSMSMSMALAGKMDLPASGMSLAELNAAASASGAGISPEDVNMPRVSAADMEMHHVDLEASHGVALDTMYAAAYILEREKLQHERQALAEERERIMNERKHLQAVAEEATHRQRDALEREKAARAAEQNAVQRERAALNAEMRCFHRERLDVVHFNPSKSKGKLFVFFKYKVLTGLFT